jgi:hypothetical protein
MGLRPAVSGEAPGKTCATAYSGCDLGGSFCPLPLAKRGCPDRIHIQIKKNISLPKAANISLIRRFQN